MDMKIETCAIWKTCDSIKQFKSYVYKAIYLFTLIEVACLS